MIFGFKPYPAYKPSGVEWLGDVPEHWEVRRLGQVGRFFKGSGGTKADESRKGVPCIRYGDLYTQHQFFITESRSCVAVDLAASEYTPIKYGDVLFAASGETMEDIGKSAVNLISTLAYCGSDVIVLRSFIEINARYIGYAADCPASVQQKNLMGRGFTVIHIYPSKLKYLVISVPPLSEQAAIADFLDHKTALIDRLIEKKKKLITLLEEYKQAIIHQAVTGRIDVQTGQPYPAYKPSGVEWLGDVPEHWQIMRLKLIVHQISKQDENLQEGLPYVALENVESWTGRVTLNYTETIESKLKLFEKGDILFAKLRPYLAKVMRSKSRGQCVGEFLVLRTTDRLSPHFLEILLRSKPVIDWINSSTFGSKMPRTDWHFVGNTRLAVPSLPKQISIARFLDNAIADLYKIADHTKKQIELLQEYRTRLIADVVTGKIDVREAAAELQQMNSAACGDEASSTLSEQHSLHIRSDHEHEETL